MTFSTKRRFRTATQLKLTPPQRYALITTLALLENGEMHHVPAFGAKVPAGQMGFTMSTWRCGSAACIGGTAELVGTAMFVEHGANRDLYDMFYMRGLAGAMDSVTPRQAAKALRNYLETGRAQWRKVLTKRQIMLGDGPDE